MKMSYPTFGLLGLNLKSALYAVALSTTLCPFATAASFDYNLDFEFSGAVDPQGTKPWLTANFDDLTSATAGGIRFTLDTANLVQSEKVTEFSFNFNPLLLATDLSFDIISIPTGLTVDFKLGTDAFKADGVGGYFDILLELNKGLTKNETLVIDISHKSVNLTLQDFIFTSAQKGPGDGTYYAAAHVQSIGDKGEGSGWIGGTEVINEPVPEPSSMAMAGLAIVGVCLRRRRPMKTTG